MPPSDAYRKLLALTTEAATSTDAARLVELATDAAALQPAVEAGGRCDLLIDGVRAHVRAASSGDPAPGAITADAARELAVDLRELHTAATRELAQIDPDPAATIKASLRWVGPPQDAERVAAHFKPADISWPNPALPAPSRFETVLRIGDSAARPHLDGVIGAVLRQLPALLGTTEGAEPPDHWWAGGRMEIAASVPVVDAARDLTLTAPVAARLAAWGATLALDLYA